MSATSLAGALQTLRAVNERLRSATIGLRPERCSQITAADFSALLAQVARAAECIRLLTTDCTDGEAEGEALREQTNEYQRNLEQLKQLLPSLQLRLLIEKARLESANAELTAKMAWARAQAETL